MPALSFEQNKRETTTQLAALILANAFIFHERLARIETRITPLATLLREANFIKAAAVHWKFILEDIINVPIIKMAYGIISAFPLRSDTENSVRNLAEKSLTIVAGKTQLQHDLMVKIYHLLLVEGHYCGTSSTSLPSATLLMKLALDVDQWPKLDWSDPAALKQLRVADLACGTGTMLMAAGQSLSDNFIRTSSLSGKAVNSDSLIEVQKIIVENIIHGFDVLPSAIHLAASTLALLAPEICSRKMHLYCLPLGKLPSGQICFGSIEYMSADRIATQLDFVSPGIGGALRVGEEEADSIAPLPQLDMCVMNPPFLWSDDANPQLGFVDGHDGKMRAELARRIRTSNLAASASAGPASIFAAVADRHIKVGGRLALVLPAAATTGVGWQRTRELIKHGYILEMVIASHDPERLSFSEDTDVTEILLIARKRERHEASEMVASKQRTKFISLWINPRTDAQAVAVAEQISRNAAARVQSADDASSQSIPYDISDVIVGSRKYGEMIEVPAHEVNASHWIGAAFAQTNLVRIAWMLRQGFLCMSPSGEMATIPMTTIGDIALLGPDRRDVTDTFTRSKVPTHYPALRGQSPEKMRMIAAAPNEWLAPRSTPTRNRKMRDASLLWRRAGQIMIVERSRMDTQRTLAVRLPLPALSQGWWPLRLREANEKAEKALVLWFNSTLGILTLLAHRVPTRGVWMQFKKQTIQSMPTLDVLALSDACLESLANAYDSITSRELGTFADMAKDELRAKIDSLFCQALGLMPIDAIRNDLSREPIISLQPCTDTQDIQHTNNQAEFELL